MPAPASASATAASVAACMSDPAPCARSTARSAPCCGPVKIVFTAGVPTPGRTPSSGGYPHPAATRLLRMPRPDQPLRVAYLVYSGNPHCGGQGVYTRELARELTALGHTVEVFSGQPYPDLVDPAQLTRVPSLDLYRPENPFRVPWPWEFKTRIDVSEFA